MDLTSYDDDALDALRLDVINEQERRQRLASIPATIADLAARYEADGGNKADIVL